MRRLLVIRPGAIGDTLLVLPVIQALKAQYQFTHCTLVGNAAVLPLTLASGIVDETFDYEQARWGQLFSERGITDSGLQTLLASFDMVICWLRDDTGTVAHNLTAVGISQVVVTPGRPPEGDHLHIVFYLAASTGLDLSLPDLRDFHLTLPSQKLSSQMSDEQNASFVVIHPGSGGARKCWPHEKYRALIEQLWERDQDVLVLLGPAEQDQWALLHSELGTNEQHRLNFLVNAPLVALAGNIQMCKCFIGNDAGITHLAAMLGLPTLALFGPTDPRIWHPVGRSVVIMYEPELKRLPVAMVLEAVRSFL